MAKSFNVSDFKASFKSVSELAEWSLFDFRFKALPKCLIGKYDQTHLSGLTMHTHKVKVPDMTIGTNQVQMSPLSIKYPFEKQNTDITIEVISSGNLWERKFFSDWQQGIIKHGVPSGSLSATGNATFDVGYYNDYVTEAQITMYNKIGNTMEGFHIANAWPMSIGELDLDWSHKEEIPTFYVTVSYSSWDYIQILK